MASRRLAEHTMLESQVDLLSAATSRSVPGTEATRAISRRFVIKTGTRLLYAAPLIVASVKLESDNADAISGGVRPLQRGEE